MAPSVSGSLAAYEQIYESKFSSKISELEIENELKRLKRRFKPSFDEVIKIEDDGDDDNEYKTKEQKRIEARNKILESWNIFPDIKKEPGDPEAIQNSIRRHRKLSERVAESALSFNYFTNVYYNTFGRKTNERKSRAYSSPIKREVVNLDEEDENCGVLDKNNNEIEIIDPKKEKFDNAAVELGENAKFGESTNNKTDLTGGDHTNIHTVIEITPASYAADSERSKIPFEPVLSDLASNNEITVIESDSEEESSDKETPNMKTSERGESRMDPNEEEDDDDTEEDPRQSNDIHGDSKKDMVIKALLENPRYLTDNEYHKVIQETKISITYGNDLNSTEVVDEPASEIGNVAFNLRQIIESDRVKSLNISPIKVDGGNYIRMDECDRSLFDEAVLLACKKSHWKKKLDFDEDTKPPKTENDTYYQRKIDTEWTSSEDEDTEEQNVKKPKKKYLNETELKDIKQEMDENEISNAKVVDEHTTSQGCQTARYVNYTEVVEDDNVFPDAAPKLHADGCRGRSNVECRSKHMVVEETIAMTEGTMEMDATEEREKLFGGSSEEEGSADSDPDSEVERNDRLYIADMKMRSMDYCPFCGMGCERVLSAAWISLGFFQHILLQHKDEPEIQRYDAMEKCSIDRLKLGDVLRHRGNFSHNIRVLSAGKGEIVVAKRPTPAAIRGDPAKIFNVKKYVPCIFCLGFFYQRDVAAHARTSCPVGGDTETQRKCGWYFREGKRLLVNATKPKASDDVTDLMSELSYDNIAETVRNDDVILRVGQTLSDKNDKKNSEGIRQRMRMLARLYLQLKKQDGKLAKKLEERNKPKDPKGYVEEGIRAYIKPEKFDDVIRATEFLCIENKDLPSRWYGNSMPSTIPIRIGQLLRKVCSVLRGMGVRMEHTKEGQDILENTARFLNLLDDEWEERLILRTQRANHDRNLNKVDPLPATEDIKNLVHSIKSDLQHVIKTCTEKMNYDLYRMLEEITLVRLVLFNMRRSSETCRMTLSNWNDAIEASKEYEDSEILASLTDLEKRMADAFLLVKIKGTKGKKVLCPCIVPPDAQQAIKMLIKHRTEVGIHEDNIYVFGVTTSNDGFIPSATMLKKYAKKYCKDAELVTSTNLRKFLATACQLLDLGETGKDYLASHLGHQIARQTAFYRQHDDAVEVAKVSQILLLAEQGKLHLNAGKSINDLDMSEVFNNMDDEYDLGKEDKEKKKEEEKEREREGKPNEDDASFDPFYWKKMNAKKKEEAKRQEKHRRFREFKCCNDCFDYNNDSFDEEEHEQEEGGNYKDEDIKEMEAIKDLKEIQDSFKSYFNNGMLKAQDVILKSINLELGNKVKKVQDKRKNEERAKLNESKNMSLMDQVENLDGKPKRFKLDSNEKYAEEKKRLLDEYAERVKRKILPLRGEIENYLAYADNKVIISYHQAADIIKREIDLLRKKQPKTKHRQRRFLNDPSDEKLPSKDCVKYCND